MRRLYGILNGTCNYILTTMRETGRDFDDVLGEAQAAGLCRSRSELRCRWHRCRAQARRPGRRCLRHAPVNFAGVHVEGIRHVSSMDIEFAQELGYRIKLLGLARETKYGVEQRVHPCMVPLAAPIAHIEGVFNAVVVEGDYVGTTMFQGRGAGQGRPPRPSSPTWSISHAAAACRPSSCRRHSSSIGSSRRWIVMSAPITCA